MTEEHRELISYKLPCGDIVNLRRLTKDILPVLDRFLYQQFIAVCDLTEDWLQYQNTAEYKDMRVAALEYIEAVHCTSPDGRAIILENTLCRAYLVYQMVQSPPWSFDDFFEMISLDPFGFQKTLSQDGIVMLCAILGTVYGDDVTESNFKMLEKQTPLGRLIFTLSLVLDELSRTDDEIRKFDMMQKAFRRFAKNCLGLDSPYKFPK